MTDIRTFLKLNLSLEKISCQKGFTILEVLIAIAVLTIGILGVNAMQVSSLKGNSIANKITEGSNWAADRMERIIVMPFDSGSNTLDDDGDGAADEADEQFLDTDGDDLAGLGDDTTATADGFFVSPDNEYTLYWNAAINQPAANMKTINIIVQSNVGFQNMRVAISSIKTQL